MNKKPFQWVSVHKVLYAINTKTEDKLGDQIYLIWKQFGTKNEQKRHTNKKKLWTGSNFATSPSLKYQRKCPRSFSSTSYIRPI